MNERVKANGRIRIAVSVIAIAASVAAHPVGAESLLPGGEYVVVRGDTLGTIAARIEGREPGTIQAIADRILELNPTAFEGGDPTEMRLGSRLKLPGDGPWMRQDAGRGA